jgi:AcrR family transcriptional regulator
MLAAMADAVAEKGYVRTSVADVIRRAGVSRETFYQQFTGKEACFRAAYSAAVDRIIGAVARALAEVPDDAPAARFGRALAAYLDELRDDHALAHTFLIEVYAAGPATIAHRVELQGRFVDLMADVLGIRSERDRFACEALVAAISALVTARVGSGRTAELRELHRPLMDVFTRLRL